MEINISIRKQSKAKQSKAKHSKAKQRKTKQNRIISWCLPFTYRCVKRYAVFEHVKCATTMRMVERAIHHGLVMDLRSFGWNQ